MIGWTLYNYIPLICLAVMFSFMLSAIITHFSEKGQTIRAGVFAITGLTVMLWGIVGLMAAPMDSVMQRDYWEEQLYIEWTDSGVITAPCKNQTIYVDNDES